MGFGAACVALWLRYDGAAEGYVTDSSGGALGAGRFGAEGLGAVMSKRVLVVDDEPNIRLSLEFLMRKAGYEVSGVEDGEAALAAVAESAPDLILLDVTLPKRSGYEVCEEVRANPDWSGVRILMLTARGRDIEREKGLALGADDYLTKPFATRDVVDRVQALLGQEHGDPAAG